MKDQTEGPLALTAYQKLQAKGRISLRINTNIAAHDLPYIRSLGIRSGFGNDYLRIGHLKLFADGTMGSQTAWMMASFSGKDEREKTDLGIILTPPAQMAEEIRTASQLGVPTSVHAIGDKANRVVLDIFEEIGQTGAPTSVPHRIEHVQIIDPEDLPRLASLGLTASVQPTHVLDDMDTADLLLGSRASNAYRFRSLIDSGGLLALGSDAPVADPNPFLGMHAALTRQRPDQMDKGPWYGQERLTMEQTIFGYTMAPAIASGWNNAIGSISPGKRADLIVVDRNPFDLLARGISGSELADTVVQMTIFDGQITEH
jgi:predicted amidohydrolase YtcJ